MSLRSDARALVADLNQRQYGNTYFVNTVSGNSGNPGTTQGTATTTFALATALATADNGDEVVVASGSTFAVAAAGGITLDKAGVTYVGQGKGTKKPTITLGTATTATVLVTAARVTLKNFRFVCDINDLAIILDVNEGEFTLEDCDFVTSSAKEALCFIDLITTKDNFTIRNCTFFQPTDPAGTDGAANTGGIYFVDSEFINVEGCKFIGNFETACIHNKTTAAKYLIVSDCYFYSALSGSEPFQLVDGCIGSAIRCNGATPAEVATTEATLVGTVGAAFFFHDSSFGNDSAAGGAGGIAPTAAS